MVRAGVVLVVCAVVLGISGCGSGASVKGCEKALRAEIASISVGGGSYVPAACKGLSAADQRRASQEVANEVLGGVP